MIYKLSLDELEKLNSEYQSVCLPFYCLSKADGLQYKAVLMTNPITPIYIHHTATHANKCAARSGPQHKQEVVERVETV